ncbi:MAG: biotin carboxylase, partial [Sandaracinaceae bacterium]|nr:biotin carboxylase [Sandaracinaceae bacterium]
LRKYPGKEEILALAKVKGFSSPPSACFEAKEPLHALADWLLSEALRARIDLFTIDELCEEIENCAFELLSKYPGHRVRLKAVGGGGGKGQRIIGPAPHADLARSAAKEARGKVLEILGEVKAGGVGDDKNIILELNIEETRHHEIQLLGNGNWCIALGGRDCSLQMHEQKLVEISLTKEELEQAIAKAKASGRLDEAQALEEDLETLLRMEDEAERFGLAVGLDSASTFECIVYRSEGKQRHAFMEMNTRIQVEHRVSELCYALRFENPENPSEAFEVSSIIEAMVLLARHGPRLPRPKRIRRHGAAIEARLNATDASLSPHPGGLIQSWSPPLPHEIRDDQGICLPHPDTGAFVDYRISGAYDSNIALLITYGESRAQALERLSEILLRTRIRGVDVHTNASFQGSLIEWMRSHGPWVKPSTRFVSAYLAATGALARAIDEIDPELLWDLYVSKRLNEAESLGKNHRAAFEQVAARQATWVSRPLRLLFDDPHFLAAWLSRHRSAVFRDSEKPLRWKALPIDVLASTYRLLNMEPSPGKAPAFAIWDHDQELLERALTFYHTLEARLGASPPELLESLRHPLPPPGFSKEDWQGIRSAHLAFSFGLELLALPFILGEDAGFFEIKVKPNQSVHFPEVFLDRDSQEKLRKHLAPPPPPTGDTIVATSGGMFYSREAPHLPPRAVPGMRVVAGPPRDVREVMKKFDKGPPPFSGTILEVLAPGDGAIIQKGQPLFKVKPDHQEVVEPKHQKEKRRQKTIEMIERLPRL